MFDQLPALVPYITAGDPDLDTTFNAVIDAWNAGASAVEIGVPFSDPLADGPVIQAAHHRALSHMPDLSIDSILKMTHALSNHDQAKPIVLMVSINLIFHYGIPHFFSACKTHGIQGVVIPDLIVEESASYVAAAKKSGVSLIFLVSPVTTDDRLVKTVAVSTGFVYVVSVTGTTGARVGFDDNLRTIVTKIKQITAIPVLVGFGVNTAAQVHTINQYADGVIVGSHLVDAIVNKRIGPAIQSLLHSGN